VSGIEKKRISLSERLMQSTQAQDVRYRQPTRINTVKNSMSVHLFFLYNSFVEQISSLILRNILVPVIARPSRKPPILQRSIPLRWLSGVLNSFATAGGGIPLLSKENVQPF